MYIIKVSHLSQGEKINASSLIQISKKNNKAKQMLKSSLTLKYNKSSTKKKNVRVLAGSL